MSNAVLLDQREKGQFPVSIGTSLALEGLFGIYPEREVAEGVVLYNGYDDLWINIRTLYRNIISCFNVEQASKFSPEELGIVLVEEMTLIRNLVSDKSGGVLNVNYYVCSYKSLSGLYPNARFKDVTTAIQKDKASKENGTVDEVIKTLGEDNDMLKLLDTTLELDHNRALVMTNYPVDLLNVKNAKEVALLESHTGVIKPKSKWNTKLHNGKDLARIPFDRMTVQVFGDSGNLFLAYPKDYRDFLLALSEEYKWNSTTTKDRVMQCVSLKRSPTYEVQFRKLYSR